MKKLSSFISLFFFVLMCIKTWVMPVLYLDYELRKSYIVQNLCENRNRPELHCDGKCYLAKRIAAARAQDEKKAEHRFIFQLLETLTDDRLPASVSHFSSWEYVEVTEASPYRNPFLSRNIVTDIFHPPLS